MGQSWPAQRTLRLCSHLAERDVYAMRTLRLRSVLAQTAGVGQGQAHEILGLELTQPAAEALAFAERLAGVAPAAVRYQERRHRMPTVAAQVRRRAVVAGHHQHGRL